MSYAGLFNGIEALSVTVNTITPGVYNYDALPTNLSTADLPARLLLPFEDRRALSSEYSYTTFGGMVKADRRIVDLLIWEPLNQSTYATDIKNLVEYIDAYEEALVSLNYDKVIVSTGGRVVGMTGTVTTVDYPYGSGNYYRAVEIILSLTEMMSRA
jgi:hypothetical protein